MEIIEEQFKVKYEIGNRCLIRSSNAGVIQQTNLNYNASVRLTCRNQYEIFNEKTNFIDSRETSITFKIPCSSNDQAGLLGSAIRNYFKSNKILVVTGSLPTFNNNEYSATINIPYDELMKILNSKK